MKIFSLIVHSALLLVAPLTLLTACSGGSSDTEEVVSTFTADDFIRGRYDVVVYGATPLYLSSTGSETSQDGLVVANIEGNLIAGELVVPVYYNFMTLGSEESPTGAFISVTFRDDSSLSDQSLINALGAAATNRLRSVEFSFNFITQTSDVRVAGYQTISSATSGTGDVSVEPTYTGTLFEILPAGSF